MELVLTDNDNEKQQEIERKRAFDLEQERKVTVQEAEHAADLEAWKVKEVELNKQFEEETRAKWEKQLYDLRKANANGPQLTPHGFSPSPILDGLGHNELMRRVSGEVDLKKAQWLNNERKEFFDQQKEERRELDKSLKRYAANLDRPPPRNYEELKIQSAKLSPKNEVDQDARIAEQGFSAAASSATKAADKVADMAAELLDIFAPAPRKVTADEYLANAESRRAYFEQQAAEQERNNTLDKIRNDRNTGKNLNPENMRDDLRKLGRDDLEIIKARGDDGIKHLIEERERERQLEHERNQGREREL